MEAGGRAGVPDMASGFAWTPKGRRLGDDSKAHVPLVLIGISRCAEIGVSGLGQDCQRHVVEERVVGLTMAGSHPATVFAQVWSDNMVCDRATTTMRHVEG